MANSGTGVVLPNQRFLHPSPHLRKSIVRNVETLLPGSKWMYSSSTVLTVSWIGCVSYAVTSIITD